MQNFQQNLQKLEAADTQVLGVSMDSTFSNAAWAEKIAVTFPLLSDWGGDVTRQYGLYNPQYKAARRVNYLLANPPNPPHLQTHTPPAAPPTPLPPPDPPHTTQ